VPGVFGVIFPSSVTGKMCLTENVLFFVDFQGEIQLFFLTFVHIGCSFDRSFI